MPRQWPTYGHNSTHQLTVRAVGQRALVFFILLLLLLVGKGTSVCSVVRDVSYRTLVRLLEFGACRRISYIAAVSLLHRWGFCGATNQAPRRTLAGGCMHVS